MPAGRLRSSRRDYVLRVSAPGAGETLESLTHAPPRRRRREQSRYVVPGALPLGPGLLGVRAHAAHQLRGMLDAGFCPLALGRIYLAVGADSADRVVDQVAVLAGHEVDVARIAGPNHGLADRHRLGHRQPEALGPMQGGVAVARGHQTAP